MQCILNFLSDLIETDKVGSVFYLCLSFLIIADAKTRKEEREYRHRGIKAQRQQAERNPEM
jgi:hypothetical protein